MQIKSMLLGFVALIGTLLLESCGGFYSLVKANINQPPITFPQGRSIAELPYLDVNVIPRLTKLQTKEFRNKRKGVLEYFVLYASFNHKALGGEVKIPLYYLNLKTGARKEYEAYKVINKFPILDNARQNIFLNLKTVAIEKSYANSASEVLSELTTLDNNLAQSIISSSPAQTIVAALNLGTSLIDKFAKKTEYNTELNVEVVDLLNPFKYKVYVVIPTNKSNVIADEDLNFINKTTLTITTETGTGDLIANISDTMRLDSKYPYLILKYNFSNYVHDTDLSLKGLENSYAIIDDNKVQQLDDKLNKATRKLLLEPELLNELISLPQQRFENAIFDRIALLQKLRKACLELREETVTTRKNELYKVITNLYEQYNINFLKVQLNDQSNLYIDHFKDNIQSVDKAVERIFLNEIPGQGNMIKSISDEFQKYNTMNFKFDMALTNDIKQTLQILSNYSTLVSNLPWFASTELAPKALFLKNEIEKSVNKNYFDQLIPNVNSSHCNTDGNLKAQSLRNLIAFWMSCESCIAMAKPTIENFDARCKQQLTEERASLTNIITNLITDYNVTIGQYTGAIPQASQDLSFVQLLNNVIANMVEKQKEVASLSTLAALHESRNSLTIHSINLIQYKARVKNEVDNFVKQRNTAESIRLTQDENMSALKRLLGYFSSLKNLGTETQKSVSNDDIARYQALEIRAKSLLIEAESLSSQQEQNSIKIRTQVLINEFNPLYEKYLRINSK